MAGRGTGIDTMGIPEPLIEALRMGKALVARVEASSIERVAGVTVLPQGSDLDGRARLDNWKPSIIDRRFVVYWREYSRRHMNDGLDMAPGDGLWELRRAEVVGEQALEDLLQSWSVSLEDLNYPWKAGVPT